MAETSRSIVVDVVVDSKESIAALVLIVAQGLEGSGASPATIRRTMRPVLEYFDKVGDQTYEDYVLILDTPQTAMVYRICRNRYDG